MGIPFGIHYTSVSVMFGAGLLVLWLLLAGYSIRDLSARAIVSLTGHLRARPDPWLETALRRAFTEFDRELAAILHDRANPARPTGSPRPSATEPSPGLTDRT
jgi:hypothetical protein